MEILELIMIISSCIYLTIAFHKVYPSSWTKAAIKSLLTSIIYLIILLLIFLVIFFIACVIWAIDMN